jgi:hypothetical protein
MIALAELPSTDGVYVLHLSEPLAHAHGYVGWAADISRRVAEHLDVEACRRAGLHVATHRGSPLICAAIRAGRSVQVAQVYPGGNRGLERGLHNRHHPRICALCRSQRPPTPRQLRLPMIRKGGRQCAASPAWLWRIAPFGVTGGGGIPVHTSTGHRNKRLGIAIAALGRRAQGPVESWRSADSTG